MSVKNSSSQHTLVGITSWGTGCATVSNIYFFKNYNREARQIHISSETKLITISTYLCKLYYA
jgi:hypothetical protein